MPSISQYHREESESVIPDASGIGGEGVEHSAGRSRMTPESQKRNGRRSRHSAVSEAIPSPTIQTSTTTISSPKTELTSSWQVS